MKVTTFVAAAVLIAVGTGLYYFAPGFRTGVNQKVQCWIGWTEAARQADPVGFTNYVQGRLEKDLEQLKDNRNQLKLETDSLHQTLREHEALLSHSDVVAEEFRTAYQQAQRDDSFPVTVRGAAYTEEQMVSQVRLVLAEAEGYRQSVANLQQVCEKAEAQLQTLTVRIDTTQSQLAMIGTQRELLRSRVLTEAGEEMIAQVDELFEENRRVVHSNPVRPVAELLAARAEPTGERFNRDAARAFLASKPKPGGPQGNVAEQKAG